MLAFPIRQGDAIRDAGECMVGKSSLIIQAFLLLGLGLPARGELITGYVTERTDTGDRKIKAAFISDGSVETSWYSAQSPDDYFESGATPPVFILDVGRDRTIDGTSFTNYYEQSSNRVTKFSLRFATDAEGMHGVGTTIPGSSFTPSIHTKTDQAEFLPFARPVNARYIELTLDDNAGSHTVGVDEIQFNAIEPIVTVSARGAIMVEEKAITSESFEIALAAAPTHAVTIALDPESEEIRIGEGVPGAAHETIFPAGNWNEPQTIDLRTTDDTVIDGSRTIAIKLTGSSDDPAFNNTIIAPVYVAMVDEGVSSETDRSPVTFEDATAELGLDEAGAGMAIWLDYNNDGWMDLSDGHLWRNDLGRKFVKVGPDGGGNNCGDIDNDGWPDRFDSGGRVGFGSESGEFIRVDVPDKLNRSSMGGTLLDVDGDGLLDFYGSGYELPDLSNYEPDGIYRNLGGRTFQLIWKSPPQYPSRGITAADFDDDGDSDVYVSNYRLCPNYLWRNETRVAGSEERGTGFVDVAAAYGALGGNGHSIGAAWGDFDNDGWIDLFAGNFSHPGQPQSRFLRNRGLEHGFTFDDKGTCGLHWQESYASPAVGDYDNDGDLDLYFTTVYGGDTAVLYRNDGNWSFTNVTDKAGLGGIRNTYQAAWCDFDNDGDLDLMSGGRLWRNGGSRNFWVKVKLVGVGKVNRSAIGAVVRLPFGDGTLTRQVESSTGQGNHNGHTLHFGLGGNKRSQTLEIAWPYTKERLIVTVPVNRVTAVILPR